jgi:hypothetical protein
MQVLQRYSQIITSFASGNWYFEKDTVTIAGSSAESNLKGICFGDVNGSYVPTGNKSAMSGDLGLIWEGAVQSGSYQQVVLPVKVKSALQTGAISLGFHFPEEYMEIEDVTLGNGAAGIVYSVENGLVRLGWSNIDPFVLNPEEVLVNLHIRTKDLSGLTSPIALQLYNDVELANGVAQPLQGITLTIPLIESLLTGGQEQSITSPELSIYPNPTAGDVLVSMLLPGQGSYEIEVYDVVGKLKETVSNEYQSPRKCMVKLGCSRYPAGVYMAKIRVTNDGKEYWFIKKVVLQK